MVGALQRSLNLPQLVFYAQGAVGGGAGAVRRACALLPMGKVEATASVSSLGILLVFAGVQSALIVLRRLKPGAKRGFRVPLSVGWLPLPAVFGIAACAFLSTQLQRRR